MSTGYSISKLDNAPCSGIDTIESLRSWMESKISEASVEFEVDAIDCYRYIASSVTFRGEGDSIEGYQTGCSPNYFGGLWSLACCKHYMRRSSKVTNRIFGWNDTESDELIPNHPMFVFTFGEQSRGHQYLASIALVTHGFKTMDAYGEYLLNQRVSEFAAKARITQQMNTTPEADRYGDCHYGPYHPSEHHPHTSESPPCSCGSRGRATSAYEEDLSQDHVICVAEPGHWITWEYPAFETRSGSKQQNAWGRPIRSEEYDTRDAFYRDALGEDGWITEVSQ